MGSDGKGEALYCSRGEGLAEKRGGLMQNEIVALHLYNLSNKSRELCVCSTRLHAGEKIKGRKGGAGTDRLRQKGGQAAFAAAHHWMALCALTKRHAR